MRCLSNVWASTTTNTPQKPLQKASALKGKKKSNSPNAVVKFPFHRVTREIHQDCWNSSSGTRRSFDHGLAAGTNTSNCNSPPPLPLWNTISVTLIQLFRVEFSKHLLLLFPYSNAQQTQTLPRAHTLLCATSHGCTTAWGVHSHTPLMCSTAKSQILWSKHSVQDHCTN